MGLESVENFSVLAMMPCTFEVLQAEDIPAFGALEAETSAPLAHAPAAHPARQPARAAYGNLARDAFNVVIVLAAQHAFHGHRATAWYKNRNMPSADGNAFFNHCPESTKPSHTRALFNYGDLTCTNWVEFGQIHNFEQSRSDGKRFLVLSRQDGFIAAVALHGKPPIHLVARPVTADGRVDETLPCIRKILPYQNAAKILGGLERYDAGDFAEGLEAHLRKAGQFRNASLEPCKPQTFLSQDEI